PEMAAQLGTEPLLIVAARTDPPRPGLQPLPVTTDGIPNNHLGYAVQWFGLAAVWLAMAGFLTWRLARGARTSNGSA
ncbi:MAG: SURF1 family cytochrome oxidase biogenesis protein, partial [Pseudomonadota bacterium]